MINAFSVLGATPKNTAEELQELFEEKELLLSNTETLKNALLDLTNPKKRIPHEIIYFANEIFDKFFALINHNLPASVTTKDVAEIVVELGRWFDNQAVDSLQAINEARNNSGFPTIDNIAIYESAENLKVNCVQEINKYMDSIPNKSVVGIFNQIVIINNYSSFFIDELMAHYGILVSDALVQKQKVCEQVFNEIKSNNVIDNRNLHAKAKEKIEEFRKSIKSWDRYAQPLQVNDQTYGGQHIDSDSFVFDIRAQIVEECNKMQEKLSMLMDALSNKFNPNQKYSFVYAKDNLPILLSNSLPVVDNYIEVLNILCSVFSELEITAAKLNKDRNDLKELRKSLAQLDNIVSPNKKVSTTSYSSNSYGSSYSSSTSSQNNGANHYFRFFLLLAIVSFILMIVGFCIGNNAMGAAFVIIGVASVVFLCLETRVRGNKYVRIALTILTIVILLCTVIPIAVSESSSSSSSSSNSSSYSSGSKSGSSGSNSNSNNNTLTKVTLTSSNFEDYFTISATASWSGTSFKVTYTISPKYTYTYSGSSSSISVKLAVKFYSSQSTSYAFKTSYINETLYKSSKYKESGSNTIYLNTSYSNVYWRIDVSSCSGTIYY